MFARRPHIQKEVAVQVAVGRERAEEKLHPAGRSLDGRLRQVLLRTDRPRSGEFRVYPVRAPRSTYRVTNPRRNDRSLKKELFRKTRANRVFDDRLLFARVPAVVAGRLCDVHTRRAYLFFFKAFAETRAERRNSLGPAKLSRRILKRFPGPNT